MRAHQRIFCCLAGLLLSVLFLHPLSVSAVDAIGRYHARGLGAAPGSCREYVRADKTGRELYQHWITGFITGWNVVMKGQEDFTHKMPTEAILQRVEDFCKENPLDSVTSAVTDLLLQIDEKTTEETKTQKE